MSVFLNPALLAGMALVAVPIVLHLIMRQRPKFYEFPALRFVRRVHETNQRTFRLRHWLLLAMRIAAIAVLALALARPVIQSAPLLGDREGPVAAALVFDTLPRLDYQSANETRLDAARSLATWLLGQLPADSQVGVIDSASQRAIFQVDLGAAQQRVERLETRAHGRSLPQSIETAIELLAEQAELPREIYVFTDLAAAAWPVAESQRLAGRLEKSGASLYIIDIGAAKPQNFSLLPPRLSSEVLARNMNLGLTCELRRIGPEGEKQLECYLLDAAQQPQKRSQQTVTVPEDSSVSVTFSIGALDPGLHQGYVRLLGSDALPIDDVCYFTCDVRAAWRVLIVSAAPVENEAFFLSEALAPTLLRNAGQTRFVPRLITFDELAVQQLAEYSAVVLLNPPPLADADWQKLASYATAGGSVALSLGSAAMPLEKFNSAAALELLPGRLAGQARYPDGNLHLVTQSLDGHPLLARFQDLGGSVGWERFPVLRYWRIEPSEASTAQVLATFSNTSPAIWEKPLGRGRVLSFATPLAESPTLAPRARWNELATGLEPWPFVMLASETATYMTGARNEKLNYLVGQSVAIALGETKRFPTYLISTPRGDQFRQAPDGQQGMLLVTATDWPGNYQVQAGGSSDRFLRGFSVNLSAASTDLARLDAAQLTERLGNAPFQLARTRDEIDRDVAARRIGSELFPLLIGAVALLLGFEYWLANRFYKG